MKTNRKEQPKLFEDEAVDNMDNLYNVSIINKHDIWLKEDEENPLNWMVMSKTQLQRCLKRKIGSKEEAQGRAIIGYDDVVWKKIK